MTCALQGLQTIATKKKKHSNIVLQQRQTRMLLQMKPSKEDPKQIASVVITMEKKTDGTMASVTSAANTTQQTQQISNKL
jgi:hypothetical protein